MLIWSRDATPTPLLFHRVNRTFVCSDFKGIQVESWLAVIVAMRCGQLELYNDCTYVRIRTGCCISKMYA